MATNIDYDTIASNLNKVGLVARGGFQVDESDDVPAMASGSVVETLVLVGNIGDSFWPSFSAAHPEKSTDNESHPTLLDDWSRRILAEIAANLGGPATCMPLFPFEGPPFHPFIRWAKKAEAVFPSPIGPLIHSDHGLWHAYRGALAFAHLVPIPEREERQSPCETCEEKPCLMGCPTGAHAQGTFDLSLCMSHILVDAGAPCMTNGCLARSACPVGSGARYAPDQAQFHMVAFRRTNHSMINS